MPPLVNFRTPYLQTLIPLSVLYQPQSKAFNFSKVDSPAFH